MTIDQENALLKEAVETAKQANVYIDKLQAENKAMREALNEIAEHAERMRPELRTMGLGAVMGDFSTLARQVLAGGK